MKRFLLILLVLALIPGLAMADGKVINLVADPDAEWHFAENAPVLEVVFPPVKGADAAILRMGDEVAMIDAATAGQRQRVADTLKALDISRVNIAFNTHPHDDHIVGFQHVPETAKMDKLVITFPEDANNHMKNTLRVMEELGIPVEHAADGDVLRVGQAELKVIQKTEKWFTDNNKSAMVMVTYGDCRLLMAADVELDAQNLLLKTCPEELDADILKYPHHGVAKAGWNFLKHISPELSVITNGRYNVKNTRKDAEKRGIPLVYTAEGTVRLRTDGNIWVVDQWELKEE